MPRHLLNPMDFSVEELDQLMDLAADIEHNPAKYAHACEGKTLATCFYEPSTRTRLSFEGAMYHLGGHVLGFSSAASSSAAKGESVSDTIRMIGCYADICAMRHPKEGAPMVASMKAKIPVINAGDGGHQHPTQTMTDLLTIRSLKGHLNNLTIGLCGDLKFGRTVHSLIEALEIFGGCHYVCIAPKDLALPAYVQEKVKKGKITFVEDLQEVIGDLDVLYMTRVQKERFVSEQEYERLKGYYILDQEKMDRAKKDMLVMHPLPRVVEVDRKLDKDPRLIFFNQAHLGMYARMALMMKTLGVNLD